MCSVSVKGFPCLSPAYLTLLLLGSCFGWFSVVLPWVLVSDLVSVCASFPCRSDRFKLVIAACASSLATNRSSSGLHFASLYPCAFSSRAVMLTVQVFSSRKLCCVMWVCCSYLNQRGLSHLEVDRVFGLRLLGLCALVASSVLSRIGLVLGGMSGYLSSLSCLSSCPHLEALGLAHSKRFLGSFYFCVCLFCFGYYSGS